MSGAGATVLTTGWTAPAGKDFSSMLDGLKKAAQATACRGDEDARRWLLAGEVGVNRASLQCLLFEFDRLQRLQHGHQVQPQDGRTKSPFVDINGVEIHEGDRLQRPNGQTFLVVYDRRRAPDDSRWRARFYHVGRVIPPLALHVAGAVVISRG